MPNKLKEIFSDDMLNMSGTLRFSDSEAYKNFLSALEIVYTEGRVAGRRCCFSLHRSRPLGY